MNDGRLRVVVQRKYIDIEAILDGKTVDEVVMEFQHIAHSHEREIFQYDYDVRFHVERWGYDGGMEFIIETQRWETDEEYALRRVEEEAKREKIRLRMEKRKAEALAKALETESEERELYEKLKAKFEEQ